MPTFAPIIASVYARFTLVVLFPTPPLHELTAMMCRTLRRPSTVSGASFVTSCAVIATLHDFTHGTALTCCFERRSNSSFTGHAGVVSSSVNVTSPSSVTRRSFTNPQFTTSSPKSGSMTLRSASRTSASRDPSGADVMDGEEEEDARTATSTTSRRRGARRARVAARRARARDGRPRDDDGMDVDAAAAAAAADAAIAAARRGYCAAVRRRRDNVSGDRTRSICRLKSHVPEYVIILHDTCRCHQTKLSMVSTSFVGGNGEASTRRNVPYVSWCTLQLGLSSLFYTPRHLQYASCARLGAMPDAPDLHSGLAFMCCMSACIVRVCLPQHGHR